MVSNGTGGQFWGEVNNSAEELKNNTPKKVSSLAKSYILDAIQAISGLCGAGEGTLEATYMAACPHLLRLIRARAQ